MLGLERDDFSSNRHPALSSCLSMISGQTLRVCPEGKPVPTFPDHALEIHPQSDAAVDSVADRLRSQRAVDKEIDDPAIDNAESQPAAIFEPVLVSDRRHYRAVAGHGGDDAGMVGKRLHEA